MSLRSALQAARANPVLGREARARSRWPGTPICLTLFLVTVGVAAVVLFSRAAVGSPGQEPGVGQMERVAYHVMTIQVLFAGLAGAIVASGVISGERERQTFDLVAIGVIDTKRLVGAKLAATVGYVLLFAAAALPIYTAVFLHAGLGLGQLAVAELLTAATALGAASMGLVASALSPSAFTAGIVSCALVATLFVDVLLTGDIPAPASGLAQTASQLRASTFGRDTTDVNADAAGRPIVPSRADLLVHPIRQANPLYGMYRSIVEPTSAAVPIGRVGRSLVPGGRSWSTWGVRLQPWQLSIVATMLLSALCLAGATRAVDGSGRRRRTLEPASESGSKQQGSLDSVAVA